MDNMKPIKKNGEFRAEIHEMLYIIDYYIYIIDYLENVGAKSDWSLFSIERLAQVEAQSTSPKEVLGKGISLN